jgi:hypothetical protein
LLYVGERLTDLLERSRMRARLATSTRDQRRMHTGAEQACQDRSAAEADERGPAELSAVARKLVTVVHQTLLFYASAPLSFLHA